MIHVLSLLSTTHFIHLPPLTSNHLLSSSSLPPSLPPPQSSPGAPYTCIYQEQEEQGSTTRVEGTVMSPSEANGLDKIVIRCVSQEVRHMTCDSNVTTACMTVSNSQYVSQHMHRASLVQLPILIPIPVSAHYESCP